MVRVKIKSQNANDSSRKIKLLEILSSNNIYVTRLINVPDGFVVLTDSDNEHDKIFNNKTKKELTRMAFRVKSLLICKQKAFKVDNHICNNKEEDIIQEICHRNEWVESINQIH